MHFLLYSFTHYQEPTLPILSYLQCLICTSDQSSGTDIGYTFFFFFLNWLREHRLTQFTQVQLFQVQAFCIYNPGLLPCYLEKQAQSVYVWGDVLVSSQLPHYELEGGVQRQRGGVGTAGRRVWWDAWAPTSALATGREAWWQQLDPTPFQKYSVSSFL